jgi:Signal transduction histidine kinase
MTEKKYKVLVVDDTEATRYAIARTLQINGYETVEAATGQEALDQVEKEKPDLVSLDIHLPDILGFEVCKRIKLNKTTAHIPVLQVSASFVTSKDKIHGLEGGADSYLTHPFEPPVLLATVKALLRTRQLNEDLRRSEELFRVALKNAPVTIYTCGTDLKYTWIHNPFHPFRTPAEHVGLTDFNLYPAQEALQLLILKKEVLSTKQGVRKMISHRVGGKELHFDVTIEPLQTAGEVTGLTVSYINITERVEGNKAYQKASEDAELASHAKSRFLSNMSHEIRTPLGVIQGYADLALEQEVTREQLNLYLETIKRNATSLTRLIGEILDLSKIEAGKIDVEKSNFSLPELIQDVNLALSIHAKSKGIALNFDIEENYPDVVFSDSMRVRQVLINIISNAVKFTDHGSVTVITRALREAERQIILFEVQDTGIGLTPEQSERLFQPFSQADSSITRKFGGTGLGLHLSKRLAEELGGILELKETQPGQGSTFVFTFDAGSVDQQAQSGAVVAKCGTMDSSELEGLPSIFKGKSVLLADDSEDNQFLFGKYLEHLGINVKICSNGQEARDEAVLKNFDAILMDIQMPVMDGYTATKELREKGLRTPIIALTAFALKDERAKAMSNGFSEYLVKPLSAEALKSTLARFFKVADGSSSYSNSGA